jgi:hypothetical protein
MPTNLTRAVIISSAALVAATGLLEPIGRISSDAGGLGSMLEAMFGGAVVGTAVLSLLVTPILLVFRWALASRIVVPLVCWVALGSVTAIGPWVVLNQPGGSIAEKILVTLDGMRSPHGFAAWFPYLLGGGMLAWKLFGAPQPANKRMEPARRDL